MVMFKSVLILFIVFTDNLYSLPEKNKGNPLTAKIEKAVPFTASYLSNPKFLWRSNAFLELFTVLFEEFPSDLAF